MLNTCRLRCGIKIPEIPCFGFFLKSQSATAIRRYDDEYKTPGYHDRIRGMHYFKFLAGGGGGSITPGLPFLITERKIPAKEAVGGHAI